MFLAMRSGFCVPRSSESRLAPVLSFSIYHSVSILITAQRVFIIVSAFITAQRVFIIVSAFITAQRVFITVSAISSQHREYLSQCQHSSQHRGIYHSVSIHHSTEGRLAPVLSFSIHLFVSKHLNRARRPSKPLIPP